MTMIRRPQFGDFVSLRDAMDRLFDETMFRPLRIGNGKHEAVPALDLYTTPEAVIAEIALPGVSPDAVDVTVADDLVTVTGSFKEEKETTEAGFVHRELSRGAFQRAFTLPAAVDAEAAKATFKEGILTLTLPKTEQVKPKHLKVEVK
jgi:HSP20 family protein